MLKIGNVEIANQIVLAPMASVSNSAYRRIAKEMGCGLIYAEMVSDKAIYYGNKKTLDLLYMTPFERPIVQQIFGSDVDSFVEASKKVEEIMHPDIIDINMGCPVPKVALRAQAGSALLKDVNKIKEIVKAVVNAVHVPVTVKIRSGWDKDHINAVEVAKAIEEAGASAICLHARTRAQGYSGKADWSLIKKVKEAVSIPVIGNGDVKSCYDAKRMLEETGCDLVMIGRASLGYPWIFKECLAYLKDGTVLPRPSDADKIKMCLKHFRYLQDFMSERQAVLEMRSQISYYLKGIPKAKEIKNQIFKLNKASEIEKVLGDLLKVC